MRTIQQLVEARSNRMTRGEFGALLRHVQQEAKHGSLLVAVRTLWHATDSSLMEAKRATERLAHMKEKA